MSGESAVPPTPDETGFGVPPVPAPAPSLLDAHRLAHQHLAERVIASDPLVRRVFTVVARRIVIEGLANLQPPLADVDRPLLLPAPRRFLSTRLAERRAGAEAAFGHIDARVAMRRLGATATILDPHTPEVLNAFLQGPVHDPKQTNAGLIRATMTNWAPEANPFAHPPSEQCGALLAMAIDELHASDAPAAVNAGWIAFVVMSIHPFVDGNGRTARACAQAVLSDALPLGVDWGLLEQYSLARTSYVDALKAGQRAARYSASTLDPRPFVELTTAASTFGAELALARLETIARLTEGLRATRLTPVETEAVLRVAVDRFADPSALAAAVTAGSSAGTGGDHPAPEPSTVSLDLVAGLVERELLAWAPRRPGALPDEAAIGVTLGPAARPVAVAVAHLRFGDHLRDDR